MNNSIDEPLLPVLEEGSLIQIACESGLKAVGHKAIQCKYGWGFNPQTTHQSVLLESGEVGLCLSSIEDSYFVIALFRNLPYAVRKKNVRVLKNGKTKGIGTVIPETI